MIARSLSDEPGDGREYRSGALCLVARRMKSSLGGDATRQKVAEQILTMTPEPGADHRALASLALKELVSFQIDDRLERALTMEGVDYRIWAPGQPDREDDTDSILVIKPFGHAASPSSLRLTPTERLSLFESERWLFHRILCVIPDLVPVLVGFDPDESRLPLCLLMGEFRLRLEETGGYMYLLRSSSSPPNGPLGDPGKEAEDVLVAGTRARPEISTPNQEETRIKTVCLVRRKPTSCSDRVSDAEVDESFAGFFSRALRIRTSGLELGCDFLARTREESITIWRARAYRETLHVEARGLLPMEWSERDRDIETAEIFVEPGVTAIGSRGVSPRSEAGLLAEPGARESGHTQAADGEDPGHVAAHGMSLMSAVGETRRLVLLGGPALGKTICLFHLAQSLLKRESSTPGVGRIDPQDKGPSIPLYGSLRELNVPPGERRPPVRTWLLGKLASSSSPSEVDAAEKAFVAGEIVLLLDGLDEVVEAQARADVAREIHDLLSTDWTRCRAVLSSRPKAFREVSTSVDWPRFALAEFDSRRVGLFLERWFAAVRRREPLTSSGRPTDPRSAAEGFLAELRKHRELERAIRHPLLLTIMALGYRSSDGQVPRRRVDLYGSVVHTVALAWERAKGQQPGLRFPETTQVVQCLAWVAFSLHSGRGDNAVDQNGLHRLVSRGFELCGIPPERAAVDAWDLCKVIRLRQTLLVETAPGRFGFFQVTLQEYLAGVHLAKSRGSEDRLQVVREQLHSSRWCGVLEFAVAVADEAGSAQLLDAIANHGSRFERWLARDMIAAVRCLSDDPAAPSDIVDRLVERLLERLGESGPGSLELDSVRGEAVAALAALPFGVLKRGSIRDRLLSLAAHGSRDDQDALDNALDREESLEPVLRKLLVEARAPRSERVSSGTESTRPSVRPLVLESEPELLGALKDPRAEVRAAAVQALMTRTPISGAVWTVVVERLEDSDPTVQAIAADVLSGGPESVLEPLVRGLSSHDPTVRCAAARSIGEGCGWRGWTTHPVEALLLSTETLPWVRHAALESLKIAASLLPALPLFPGSHAAGRSFGEAMTLALRPEPMAQQAIGAPQGGLSHALIDWSDRTWALVRKALPPGSVETLARNRAAACSAGALAGIVLSLRSPDGGFVTCSRIPGGTVSHEVQTGLQAPSGSLSVPGDLGLTVRAVQVALLLHVVADAIDPLLQSGSSDPLAQEALRSLYLPGDPDSCRAAIQELAAAGVSRLSTVCEIRTHTSGSTRLACARLVCTTVLDDLGLPAREDLDREILERLLLTLACRHDLPEFELPPLPSHLVVPLTLDALFHELVDLGSARPLEAVTLADVEIGERLWPVLRAGVVQLDVDLGEVPEQTLDRLARNLGHLSERSEGSPMVVVLLRSGAMRVAVNPAPALVAGESSQAISGASAIEVASSVSASLVDMAMISNEEATKQLEHLVSRLESEDCSSDPSVLSASALLARKAAPDLAVELLTRIVGLVRRRGGDVRTTDVRTVVETLAEVAGRLDPGDRRRGFEPLFALASSDTTVDPWALEALAALSRYRGFWLDSQVTKLVSRARKAIKRDRNLLALVELKDLLSKTAT